MCLTILHTNNPYHYFFALVDHRGIELSNRHQIEKMVSHDLQLRTKPRGARQNKLFFPRQTSTLLTPHLDRPVLGHAVGDQDDFPQNADASDPTEDSSEDDSGDEQHITGIFAGLKNERLSCHLNATLMALFSSPCISAFLHGNFFASELILFELARLQFVLCDEPKSQSTLKLQSLLERHPSFQNYFGIIQDARETFLYLLDALKQEGGDGMLLAELMCVTTVQEIVYDCGHRDLI
jgi:hypothetical protein